MSNENKASGKLSAGDAIYLLECQIACLWQELPQARINQLKECAANVKAAMKEYATQQATAGQECTKCEGTGMFNYDPALGEENDLCSECHGSGRLQSQPHVDEINMSAERVEKTAENKDEAAKAPDMNGFELAKELYDIAALQLMENVSGNSREALKEIVEKFESQSVAVKAIEPKAPSAGVSKEQVLNDFFDWYSTDKPIRDLWQVFVKQFLSLPPSEEQLKNKL